MEPPSISTLGSVIVRELLESAISNTPDSADCTAAESRFQTTCSLPFSSRADRPSVRSPRPAALGVFATAAGSAGALSGREAAVQTRAPPLKTQPAENLPRKAPCGGLPPAAECQALVQ